MNQQVNDERPHILVVDDEPVNRMLLERIFQREAQVRVAEDGPSALAMLAQYPCDLVLLDIMMPVMNGLEVLEKLRESPSTQELPVILITALTDTEDVVRGLELGANDYIGKPFEVDVVRARVRTQLALKRLLNERLSLIDELQTANDLKLRLMRIASHDLKNPIGNAQLALSLLKDNIKPDSPDAEIIKLAEGSLNVMLSVIQDFLDSGILDDGSMQVELEPVSLSMIVTDVLDQYAAMAENKGLYFDIELAQLQVIADERRFSQALSNIISNAIKYSPSGATIRIHCDRQDDIAYIHVIDQGAGIPPAERNRLFQPFGKLSTRPTAGENSTGLGLWIVRQVMHLQNGDVGVQPTPTGGSDFWLSLPLAEAG